MKTISLALACISLLVCLILPVLFFWGNIEAGTFRNLFIVASIGWFVFATMYSMQSDSESESVDV